MAETDAGALIGPDGLLHPEPVLLSRLQGHQGPLRLQALPPGNRALPDLLALAGVSELEVADAAAGRWQGPGGGSVVLNGAVDRTLSGELPGGFATTRTSPDRALERQRTAALLATTQSIAQMTGFGAALAPGALAAGVDMPRTIANALCRRRRALACLGLSSASSASLEDPAGARHAFQVGADGSLLVSLPLDPLEHLQLRPGAGAAPSCHWEVSEQVLDNGRVRVELDALGQLVRLSGNSLFTAWLGPALQVLQGDQLLGPARVQVLEAGPVRARLALVRPEIGLLLSLDAGADALAVEVVSCEAGTPAKQLWLELPLALPTPALVQDGGPLRPWLEDSAGAVRGLACVDLQGCGLVMGSATGLWIRRARQGLAIRMEDGVRFALCPHGELKDGPTPWSSSETLVQHVVEDGLRPQGAALLHLGLPAQIDAAWLVPGPGMCASVLLRECLGTHARVMARWRQGGAARWLLGDAAGQRRQGRGALFSATLAPHALARLDLACAGAQAGE